MAPVQQQSSEMFRKVVEVNVVGAFHGLKCVSAAMTDSGGGVIVNTAMQSSWHGGSTLYGRLCCLQTCCNWLDKDSSQGPCTIWSPSVCCVPWIARGTDVGITGGRKSSL